MPRGRPRKKYTKTSALGTSSQLGIVPIALLNQWMNVGQQLFSQARTLSPIAGVSATGFAQNQQARRGRKPASLTQNVIT